MAGPWEKNWGSAPQQGVIIRDPYRANEESRRNEDQAMERERLRLSQEGEARQREMLTKPADGYQWTNGPGSPQTFIPGGPADPATIAREKAAAAGTLTPEALGTAKSQYGTLVNLATGVKKLKDQYANSFKGKSAAEYLPGVVRPANAVFNDTSGGLSAFIATALGLSGQQFNTPAEQQLFIGSILPKSGDTDEQIENKLSTLDDLIGNARQKGRMMLGYTDETDPLLKSKPFLEYLPTTPDFSGGGGSVVNMPPPTGSGTGTRAMEIPAEMQGELDQFLSRYPRGQLPAEQFTQYMEGLNRKYGFPGAAQQGYNDWVRFYNEERGPVNSSIPGPEVPETQAEQLIGSKMANPFGVAALNYGNAALAGIPGLFTEGQATEAMQNEFPIASTLGNVGGGVTGTLLTGGVLGRAAEGVASPVVQALMRSPVVADVLYGGTFGGNTTGDLTGAAAGAGGALIGGGIGNLAGRGVNAVRRAETGGMSGGERDVLGAIGGERDAVVQALQQGQDLGVPLSLSDVSRPVNALTGAAIRRNPEAADPVIQALAQRGRGQYDRFTGAVERDLGSVTNIPQRSDELLTQARAAAGPLYREAYSAPGASSVQIDDLVNRPTFKEALQQAYREVGDEGIDPKTLGFDLDDQGEVIITQVPSWQTLDYLKRGLDNVIESGTSKLDGASPTARSAIGMKNELLGRMDAINPTYAQARSVYAGPASERQFLKQGQDAVRSKPDQLQNDVSKLSPARVGQMQLGFQSSLNEQAGGLRNSSNPFSTLDTPNMGSRLDAMYPGRGDDVARLLAQRDLEGQAAGSANRLYGNSMTAERQIADQAFNGDQLGQQLLQGGIETAVTGAPVVTALRSGLGQRISDAASLGFGRRAEQRAAEILPLGGGTNTPDIIAQILALGDRYDAAEAINQLRAQSAQKVGSAVGSGSLVGGIMPYTQ